MKVRQDGGTEHGAIGTRIYEEGSLYPGAVAGQNLAADHRPQDAAIAQIPHAVNLHRYGLPSPGGGSGQSARRLQDALR